MSKPTRCHKHLEFNVEEDEEDFHEEINSIFARYGVAYQLNEDGHITRLLPEELQSPLRKAEFHTGDVELDSLLEDARRKFLIPTRNSPGVTSQVEARRRFPFMPKTRR